MLVDYGIDRTTDKRAWISRALKLIAGLESDDSKYPWKFVRSVNENLKIETEALAPQAECALILTLPIGHSIGIPETKLIQQKHRLFAKYLARLTLWLKLPLLSQTPLGRR